MTAAILALALNAACTPQTVRRAKPLMATYVEITARGCDETALEEGIRAAFAEAERLAGALSEWDADSAVSRVNAAAGARPVTIPPALEDVLAAGQEAFGATHGGFDVTWAALAGLWRFDGTQSAVPDSVEVARRVKLVGSGDLILDRTRHTGALRRPGMRLGLGGLAKGYIAEAAADVLVARGVADVLVAASGDVAARGLGEDGRPWRVAIRDPEHADGVVATIELSDESVSTAGDYERFFVANGHRYHHILDPRTGYPAEGVRSVSVVSKRGVWADALDTGLFVLGIEQGTRTANGLPDIGALFVDEAGRVHVAGPLGVRFTLSR